MNSLLQHIQVLQEVAMGLFHFAWPLTKDDDDVIMCNVPEIGADYSYSMKSMKQAEMILKRFDMPIGGSILYTKKRHL